MTFFRFSYTRILRISSSPLYIELPGCYDLRTCPKQYTCADPEVMHSNVDESVLYFISRKNVIYSELLR